MFHSVIVAVLAIRHVGRKQSIFVHDFSAEFFDFYHAEFFAFGKES